MGTQTEAQPSAASALRLKDKVAIITGSAQGIGFATAELFAQQGAKLVLVDVDAAKVEQAAKTLEAAGAPSLGLTANVASFDDCEAVVKKAIEKFGKIDILVNNAGITRDNLLMRMS